MYPNPLNSAILNLNPFYPNGFHNSLNYSLWHPPFLFQTNQSPSFTATGLINKTRAVFENLPDFRKKVTANPIQPACM